MEQMVMRRVRPGEVPPDGATALQDDPDRPVFRGHGPYDYVCVQCGNVLAQAMSLEDMNKRVRIKCGRCKTITAAVSAPKVETGRASAPAPTAAGRCALHPWPRPLRRRRP